MVRFFYCCHVEFCRIRQAVEDKANIVDVDGSYLFRKHKHLKESGLNVAPLELPPAPLRGWGSVSEGNVNEVAEKMPKVTAGMLNINANTAQLLTLPL